MSATVIHAHNVWKYYAESGAPALAAIDWRVERGACWALLGANGAGKSTLLRAITGLSVPSIGSCQVLGVDTSRLSHRERQRIGYAAPEASPPPYLRARDLVDLQRALCGGRWDSRIADDLGATTRLNLDKQVGELSTGERTAIGLVLALASKPELAILDEPFAGLDASVRQHLASVLADLLAGGDTTFVISSHQLGELERLASDVAILRSGRMVACGSQDSLKDSVRRIRVPVRLTLAVEDALQDTTVLHREESSTETVLFVAGFDEERWKARDASLRADVDLSAMSLEEILLVHMGAKS